MLGNERFVIATGALKCGNRLSIPDIAKRDTNVTQHAPPLGSFKWRTTKLGPESVLIQRE